ncbi:unnamed protein product, partial [Lampetra planeri]
GSSGRAKRLRVQSLNKNNKAGLSTATRFSSPASESFHHSPDCSGFGCPETAVSTAASVIIVDLRRSGGIRRSRPRSRGGGGGGRFKDGGGGGPGKPTPYQSGRLRKGRTSPLKPGSLAHLQRAARTSDA